MLLAGGVKVVADKLTAVKATSGIQFQTADWVPSATQITDL